VSTHAEAARAALAPLIVLDGLEPFVPGTGPLSARRLGAGHSNETFLVERDRSRFVLRRPPRPPFAPSAHDVGREYRVLSALAGTAVPVPRPIVHCPDAGPIGAPFYLMEHVDGEVIRRTFPHSFAAPGDRRAVVLDLARTLAEVHAVDWAACGLSDLSRHGGYLERQLRRWRSQWVRNATRRLPAVEQLGDWLERTMPEAGEVTLVHGDFKLDNVIFEREPPARLTAVLDWEMAALGDPLADLGLLSASYVQPGDELEPMLGFSPASLAEGSPTRAELVDAYAEHSGRSLAHLRWYECLAMWKIVIIIEGGFRRYLAGSTADPFFEQVDEGLPRVASRALDHALHDQ
jgi:aminoglycoside phosphotransferase (APT) family kinase protein